MHVGVGEKVDYARLSAAIADMGGQGFTTEITELDVAIRKAADYSGQGSTYWGVTNACSKDAHCLGVTTWGFTDKYSWESGKLPLPFDKGYAPKPAYYAESNALQGKAWP
jgi:endo-1,4-beta-xylanase